MSLDRFYHGDGGDQLGPDNQLLNGNNRYKVLWDGDKFGSGFGILSGVTKNSVKEIINMPTTWVHMQKHLSSFWDLMENLYLNQCINPPFQCISLPLCHQHLLTFSVRNHLYLLDSKALPPASFVKLNRRLMLILPLLLPLLPMTVLASAFTRAWAAIFCLILRSSLGAELLSPTGRDGSLLKRWVDADGTMVGWCIGMEDWYTGSGTGSQLDPRMNSSVSAYELKWSAYWWFPWRNLW